MENDKTVKEITAAVAAVPDARAAIVAALAETPERSLVKMLMRVICVLTAWIAAGMAIGGIVGLCWKFSEYHLWIFGGMLLLLAVLLWRGSARLFARSFALAAAFSGNILLLMAVEDCGTFRNSRCMLALAVQALAAAAMYPLLPSFHFRLVSVLPLPALAVAALLEKKIGCSWQGTLALDAVTALPLAGAAALLLLCPGAKVWRPLVYGLLVGAGGGLVYFSLVVGANFPIWRLNEGFCMPAWWLTGSVLTLAIGLTIARALPAVRGASAWRWVALALALLALGVWASPGILLGLLLLVAGYAYADRLLLFPGYAALAWFITQYYFSLALPLDIKGFLLIGCGGVMLLARWALKGADNE